MFVRTFHRALAPAAALLAALLAVPVLRAQQPLSGHRDYPPLVLVPLNQAQVLRTADGLTVLAAGSTLIIPTGDGETRVLLPAEATALGQIEGLLVVACRNSLGYLDGPSLDNLRYRALRTLEAGQAVTRIATRGHRVFCYSPQRVYIYTPDGLGGLTEQSILNAEAQSFAGCWPTSEGIFLLQANGQWRNAEDGPTPPAWPAGSRLVASASSPQGQHLLLDGRGQLLLGNPLEKLRPLGRPAVHGLTDSLVGLAAAGQHWVVASRQQGCLLLAGRATNPLQTARRLRPFNREATILAACGDLDGRLWLAHPTGWSWVYVELPVSDLGPLAERPRGRINRMLPLADGRVYLATGRGLLSNHQPEHAPVQQFSEYKSLKTQFVIANYPLYRDNLNEILALEKQLEKLDEKQKPGRRVLEQRRRIGQELTRRRGELARIEANLNAIWERQAPTRLSLPGFDYVTGFERVSCRDLIDAGGSLLVAADEGVFVLQRDKRRERLRDPRLVECTRLVALPQTPDRLLAVCEGNRLHRLRLRNGRWDYDTEIEWLKPHRITSAVARDAQSLWLGTEAGLFRLQFREVDDALPQVIPHPLKQNKEAEGRVYIGLHLGSLHVLTEDRILVWTGRDFRNVSRDYLRSEANGYLMSEVLGIPLAGDDRHLVWARSGRLEWWARSRADSLTQRTSDVLALLPAVQALALKGDSLWVGTERRVYRLHLHQLPDRSLPKKQFNCLIRNAHLVHGHTKRDSLIDLRQPLSLAYAPLYRLHLTLDVNTFDAPERLVYQLETRDGSWANLVSHQEALNLEWGYGMQQIRVRAVDGFGNISQPAVLNYWIEPPLGLRWYMLAFYAIGLVALATWGLRAVERWAERKAQARNEALERLVQERTATIDAQRKELEALVRDLNDKNAELELQQTVIQRANDELATLNHELVENRAQLVQSEKLAALGEITPAIAHEINSPLGALGNTLDTMGRSLPQLLAELPAGLAHLSPETAERLRQLIPVLIAEPMQLSARDERRAIRSLAPTLADLGLPNAEALADRLVRAGLHHQLDALTPLLLGAEREEALTLLEPIAAAGRQLQIMRRSVERSIHIVKALKDYVHRRTDSETPVAFNLVENIELVLTLYDYHIRRGIELIQEYEELPDVVGFPEELSQVWTNLIMNAVYALNLRIREAQLAGETFQAQLRIGVKQAGAYAEVCFADNGPGIPAPIQDRIFEALFTTKPKGEGTGLGLSICRKIVEKHGGEISFESQPGLTEFTIRLPLAGPPPLP